MMQNIDSAKTDKNLSNVIKINEAEIQNHLGQMVRSTVEETLNNMLDAEADRLCNATRYERTETRTDGRAGHYKRKLHTKAGAVELPSGKQLTTQLLRRIFASRGRIARVPTLLSISATNQRSNPPWIAGKQGSHKQPGCVYDNRFAFHRQI